MTLLRGWPPAGASSVAERSEARDPTASPRRARGLTGPQKTAAAASRGRSAGVRGRNGGAGRRKRRRRSANDDARWRNALPFSGRRRRWVKRRRDPTTGGTVRATGRAVRATGRTVRDTGRAVRPARPPGARAPGGPPARPPPAAPPASPAPWRTLPPGRRGSEGAGFRPPGARPGPPRGLRPRGPPPREPRTPHGPRASGRPPRVRPASAPRWGPRHAPLAERDQTPRHRLRRGVAASPPATSGRGALQRRPAEGTRSIRRSSGEAVQLQAYDAPVSDTFGTPDVERFTGATLSIDAERVHGRWHVGHRTSDRSPQCPPRR